MDVQKNMFGISFRPVDFTEFDWNHVKDLSNGILILITKDEFKKIKNSQEYKNYVKIKDDLNLTKEIIEAVKAVKLPKGEYTGEEIFESLDSCSM